MFFPGKNFFSIHSVFIFNYSMLHLDMKIVTAYADRQLPMRNWDAFLTNWEACSLRLMVVAGCSLLVARYLLLVTGNCRAKVTKYKK